MPLCSSGLPAVATRLLNTMADIREVDTGLTGLTTPIEPVLGWKTQVLLLADESTAR
jgi:hypothetical protein